MTTPSQDPEDAAHDAATLPRCGNCTHHRAGDAQSNLPDGMAVCAFYPPMVHHGGNRHYFHTVLAGNMGLLSIRSHLPEVPINHFHCGQWEQGTVITHYTPTSGQSDPEDAEDTG